MGCYCNHDIIVLSSRRTRVMPIPFQSTSFLSRTEAEFVRFHSPFLALGVLARSSSAFRGILCLVTVPYYRRVALNRFVFLSRTV
jgi:hypothetical protein